MAVSVDDVKRLREMTGAGMMDCKNALTEAGGDVEKAVTILREYLEGFDNVVTCGRNGLHRYNNQDHSMWTAILAALNLTEGTSYDVWSVNTDAQYLEEGHVVDALADVELVG